MATKLQSNDWAGSQVSEEDAAITIQQEEPGILRVRVANWLLVLLAYFLITVARILPGLSNENGDHLEPSLLSIGAPTNAMQFLVFDCNPLSVDYKSTS